MNPRDERIGHHQQSLPSSTLHVAGRSPQGLRSGKLFKDRAWDLRALVPCATRGQRALRVNVFKEGSITRLPLKEVPVGGVAAMCVSGNGHREAPSEEECALRLSGIICIFVLKQLNIVMDTPKCETSGGRLK